MLERWKINQPGSCNCPCGDFFCFFPCCVYGLQFYVSAKADNQTTPAGSDIAIVNEMYCKVNHYLGGDDTSLNYASFEKVIGTASWRRLVFGGGKFMHTFGVPVKTEDVLCVNPEDLPNFEITLVFEGVANHIDPPGSLTTVGDTVRLWLQEPVFRYFFDGIPHAMTCLGAEAILGSWNNLSDACLPSVTDNYTDIAYRGVAAIKYKFGWASAAEATTARGNAPKTCLTVATADPAILAAVWSNVDPADDLADCYSDASDRVCFKPLPCDASGAGAVTVYVPQDDCDDVDCPPCVCCDDAGDWIWSDLDSVVWSDSHNAVWSDSLDNTCWCGCSGADLLLGVPTYLDLPKVLAAGVTPNGLTVSACVSGFVLNNDPIVLCFAHSPANYGKSNWSEFPFILYWNVAIGNYAALFTGYNTATGGPSAFTVPGSTRPGISSCMWHKVKLEYHVTNGWRLGVDINDGVNYDWGDYKLPNANFSMFGPRAYYWGCGDKQMPQLTGHIGNWIPPGSLKTS